MKRITIMRDKFGNVCVTGNPDMRDDFFVYAFGKVLDGTYKEISWEPIDPLLRQKEDD